MKAGVASLVFGLSLGLASSSASYAAAGEPDPKSGNQILPSAASEGARDLEALRRRFGAVVREQKFGSPWRSAVSPPPAASRALARVESHPALSRDPIEVQQQVQYEEATGVEQRFGWVSVRAVRVYRYGKLSSLRLVMDRIGASAASDPAFRADVEILRGAFQKVGAALGLGPEFKIVKNDLVEQPLQKPEAFPSLPLRIEIAPRPGA